MTTVSVRPVDDRDLELLARCTDGGLRAHHLERAAAQRAGTATYLVAWDGERSCGRVTVLHRSKYAEVRGILGELCELNALEAAPTGAGIGSRLIAAALDVAAARGVSRVGLAVELENPAARRLYERLGFREWGRGPVIDRWDELEASGAMVSHADRCAYLVMDLADTATSARA